MQCDLSFVMLLTYATNSRKGLKSCCGIYNSVREIPKKIPLTHSGDKAISGQH